MLMALALNTYILEVWFLNTITIRLVGDQVFYYLGTLVIIVE